jgi:hypothetical protein
MSLFSITVRPYSDKRRPQLKYVLRVRHPDRKVERFFYQTEKKASADVRQAVMDATNAETLYKGAMAGDYA